MEKTEETKRQELAPRPEARPLTWNELSEEQQKAAQDACTLLRKLANARWEKPKKTEGARHFLPPIDKERLNHVLLIDGGRGSGKTALLITLLDEWNAGVLREERSTLSREVWQGERAPVVPVGLVDLQPLPVATNLLLHLVGQFQRLIEAIEQHGVQAQGSARSRDRATWYEEEAAKETGSRAKWGDFLRAAASGWDGSLQGRRANLDPEAYAYEVEEAGRKRLDVVTCFRELVDELTEEYVAFQRLNEGEAPLFVVAIDDADMNPKRALDLLDLVRTLWHPRVAFVLTGHSEMFDEVLRAHALRELRRPLEGLHVPDDAWKSVFPSSDTARDLARNIYEKAIPPGQRLKLSEITPAERFEKLKKELAKVSPFRHRLHLQNLAEYFDLQPQAKVLLPGRLRPLLDFGQDLVKRAEDMMRELRLEGREDESPAEHILRALYEGSGGANEPSDKGPLSDVISTALSAAWGPYQTQTVQHTVGDPFAYHFQYGQPFRATLEGKSLPAKRVAAALVVADLEAFMDKLELGLQGFAVHVVYRSEPFRECRFAWPLPSWSTPLNYSAFLYLWGEVSGLSDRTLERAIDLGHDITRTAKRFIAAVLAFTRLRHERAPAAEDANLPPIETELQGAAREISSKDWSWSELAEEVAVLAAGGTHGTATRPEKAWALGYAGLLAAPESGVSAEDANEWLKALRTSLKAMWDERIVDILAAQRRHRAQIALNPSSSAKISDQRIDELLDVIDISFDKYAWANEIRRGASKVSARLESALGSIYATALFNPKEFTPATKLLTSRRWKVLQARASTKLKEQWIDIVEKYGKLAKAPVIIRALWNAAIELGEAPGLRKVQNLNETSLSGLYDSLGEDPWGPEDTSLFLDVGPKVRVAEAAFDWKVSDFRDTLSGPLYELAWDVMLNTEDHEKPSNPNHHHTWWIAGGGRRENSELPIYPWPAVDWPAFVDHHLLAQVWNATYPTAQRATEVANSLEEEQIGDDLAFWFISAVKDTFAERAAERVVMWQGGVVKKRWHELIHQMSSKNYQQRDGDRWSTYAAWCRALPLFAAPESGLSDAVATTILSAAFPEGIPEASREELHKLRRDRLAYRKPKGQRIEPELRRIDEENPGHPWVDLIEKRNEKR